jgi:hypothetical protein
MRAPEWPHLQPRMSCRGPAAVSIVKRDHQWQVASPCRLGGLSLNRACAARTGLCGAALLFLLGTSAFGAEAAVNDRSEFLFLVQIGILIFAGRGSLLPST